jgi:hypothetical protein
MIALLLFFLAALASPFRSKSRLEAENAALRHQLIVFAGRALGVRTFVPRKQACRYRHNYQQSSALRPHPIPLRLFWRTPVRCGRY